MGAGFGSSMIGLIGNEFHFRPKHKVATKAIDTNYFKVGNQRLFVQFDIKDNLDIGFKYDKNGPEVSSQFRTAVFKAITEGPLKGVQFFVEPADWSAVEGWYDGTRRYFEVPVKVTASSTPSGLILPTQLVASSWDFFIPSESEEGKALALAASLAALQWESAHVASTSSTLAGQIAAAEANLIQAMAQFV